jgi:hypothetical protein
VQRHAPPDRRGTAEVGQFHRVELRSDRGHLRASSVGND